MTHVMRVSGHARFNAVTTGSTCTASPSADSMTIAISRGGRARRSRSAMQRLTECDQLHLPCSLAVLLLEFLARAVHATLHRDAPVSAHVAGQPRAVEVDEPGLWCFRITRDQDVAEIEVRMQQPRIPRATQQRTGSAPCGHALTGRRTPRTECQYSEISGIGNELSHAVRTIEDSGRVDCEGEERGRLDVVLAQPVTHAQLRVRPRLPAPQVAVLEHACDRAAAKCVTDHPPAGPVCHDSGLTAPAQSLDVRLAARPLVQRAVFDQRMARPLERVRAGDQRDTGDIELTVASR